MATYNPHELSIQIHLNGLSFCILDTHNKSITYLKQFPFSKTLTPFDVLNRINTILSTESVFNTTFNAVNLIYENELCTIVPTEIYNEDKKASYLKYNTKILKTDFIASEMLKHNSYTSVYVPYININNYIYDNFGAFEYKHAATILIDTALQRTTTALAHVYLNVNPTSFEIVVIHNNTLQLYNSFSYTTKEDFIYYVLFVYEQLALSNNNTPITLSGTIEENDAIYNILYTYIKHINFVENTFKFTFETGLDTSLLHKHHLILNAITCE